MNVDMKFVAMSVPAILVLGGLLFLLIDHSGKTPLCFIGPLLIFIGVVVYAGLALLKARRF